MERAEELIDKLSKKEVDLLVYLIQEDQLIQENKR